MICNPGPVFGFTEDRPNLSEAQFSEDSQLEGFPIRFLQSVQCQMNSEGGVPIHGFLLHALFRIRDIFLWDWLSSALAPFFIQEEVFCNRTQPGNFVRFSTEVISLGKSTEKGFLCNIFCLC